MATLEELEDALITAGESGNTKATASISDAMRAHPTFQGNAKEKLASLSICNWQFASLAFEIFFSEIQTR